MLELRGVRKYFELDKLVLKDLDLTLQEGEFLSLIGPSGCGKSTILRLVAGLIEPSKGCIEQGNTGARLAYVFQDATLLPWLTVRENTVLPLRIEGIDAETRCAAGSHFLDLVGLADVADYYPRELSGGMRMRVSIARALATEPDLLLLDEPFGALDEMTRDGLNEELLRLRDLSHWTSMFVTHSVAEAVFLSSRVVILAPNPGTISRIVDIPLPFPRTDKTRQEAYYQSLVVEVSQALRQVQANPQTKVDIL